jgi:nucleoside-diphosphate-sugar epimerase
MPNDNVHRRVIITGGAGFLGRHLANHLAVQGWQVTVFDDLSSDNASFAWPVLNHPSIRLIEGSTFDTQIIEALVTDHKYVVHLASVVGVGETIDHPIETAENLVGTLNIAKAMTTDHVLIFGSSADVYGIHSLYNDGPMREDDHVAYEHALVNRWVYPKIKAVEESVVAASVARSVSIRIFNAYGPDMDFPRAKRVIPQFVRQIFNQEAIRIHGSGQQVRSFCYYTDMIDGLARCLDYASGLRPQAHETMNMGSDCGISMLDLARLLMRTAFADKLLDSELPIKTEQTTFYNQTFNDAWHRIPDLTRIKARLGFRQRVPLEEGLLQTLRGYRELLRQREIMIT